MDLTQGTLQEKTDRAKKNMMWFAMISMFMTFAGLTSAYIVSNQRADWSSNFEFPKAFYLSLITIFLSSICFYLFKKTIQLGQHSKGSILLIATFLTGILFVYLQIRGFGEIINQGFFPTGSESTIATSFIYAIVFVHLAHILGGLLVLSVVGFNHFKRKYTITSHLGVVIAGMYWHFVDALWVYLFCFLLFMQ